ncbi:FtsX-like permease family protein [Streptomyces sp. NPDC058052]|uniref:ABC transporter permease n=1 Tax=Streptomyces sp. NPDC058052 TaxID=3346316 RepID=UPI0036EB6893
MLRLAWRTFSGRRTNWAASFLALVLALIMTTACAVLLESSTRGEPRAERYAAADVVVSGYPFVPRAEALREALEELPAVERVVSELSFPTTAVDGSGEPVEPRWGGPSLGHAWDSAVLGAFALTRGRAPARDDEVVLDGALAARLGTGPGDSVRLAGPDGPRAYRVAGVADPPRRLARQYAVFHTPGEAARLTAGSAEPVRAVGVVARTSADVEALRRQVEREAGRVHGDGAAPVVVASGAGRAEAEFWNVPDPGSVLSSLVGTFGVLALFVAGFVVSGTLSLAVSGRLTEIGLLRAVAATTGQIRRMIAAEALLVTVAAALVGVPGGIGLALLLHRFLVDGEVLPPSFALSVGPAAPWLTVGLTLLTAQIASFAAARRASRVRPVEVLRESAVPAPGIGRWRVLAGAGVLAAAGGALGAMAAGRLDGGGGTAESMVLVLMVGVALLAPPLFRAAGALLLVPVRPFLPKEGGWAVRNLQRQHGRLASTGSPLVLAVSLTATLLCAPLITSESAERADRQRLLADHVVTSGRPVLAPEFAERAARIPGVAAASGQLPVDGGLRRADAGEGDGGSVVGGRLVAMRADAVGRLLDLGVRAGSIDSLGTTSLALGAGAAGELGAGVGDDVRVDWADGTHGTFRVAAVYAHDRGFADALLPRAAAARHAADPLEGTVLVRTAAGADRDAVGRRLAALAAEYPGARVDGAGAPAEGGSAPGAAGLFVLLLLAMINVFTAIAVVNTLGMATAKRRGEFALLRLAGAQSGQVLRMLAWEAVLTCVVALSLAALVCLAVLVPLSLSLGGTPVPALAGGALAALAVGAPAVTAATAVLVGGTVMRRSAATPGGLARAVS